jgi:hypothetical protein
MRLPLFLSPRWFYQPSNHLSERRSQPPHCDATQAKVLHHRAGAYLIVVRSMPVSFGTRFGLIAAIIMATTGHLPAPISEVETPTPAPKASSAPKESATSKQKVRERQTTSATSKPMPRTSRNSFDGTWSGFLTGSDDYRTFVITGGGATVIEKGAKVGTHTWGAARDGGLVRWSTPIGCAWTFTLNADGNTAMITANCSGLFGVGAGSWSATFRRQQ